MIFEYLASDEVHENTIRQELLAAGLEPAMLESLPPEQVSAVSLLGARRGDWEFRRTPSYWVATAKPRGRGMHPESARHLNRNWKAQIRAQGMAGGNEVITEYVDTYHIDTPQGLAMFAQFLRGLGIR